MATIAAVATPASAPALERIDWAMNGVNIEIPSWGFVNTGTRFRVFPQQGVPRSVFEKIDDAATVNRYTGIAGSVSLHIPWDKVDDYAALAAYAGERGLGIGGINSNTFQDEDYKLGSICNPDARVRAKAVDAIIECCEIAGAMDAQAVKVWLGDGTNYPGQDDLRWRHRRLVEGLQRGLRRPAGRRPDVPRVQALRARPVRHRRPGLGPEPQRRPPAGRPGRRVRGHRPPRDGRQHRADRGAAPRRGPPRRVRPQRQEVRRRRPDGRLDRPLPAVPDRARARERDARRGGSRWPRRAPTGRSTCSTSATTSSPRSRP